MPHVSAADWSRGPRTAWPARRAAAGDACLGRGRPAFRRPYARPFAGLSALCRSPPFGKHAGRAGDASLGGGRGGAARCRPKRRSSGRSARGRSGPARLGLGCLRAAHLLQCWCWPPYARALRWQQARRGRQGPLRTANRRGYPSSRAKRPPGAASFNSKRGRRGAEVAWPDPCPVAQRKGGTGQPPAAPLRHHSS